MATENGGGPHFFRPGELDDLALLPGIMRRMEVELKTDLDLVRQRQETASDQLADLSGRMSLVEKMLRKIDERIDRALAREPRIDRVSRVAKKSRRGAK